MEEFKKINILGIKAIIIDFGTGQIKAGPSGEEKPLVILDSYIGFKKLTRAYPQKMNEIEVGPSKEIRGLYKLEKAIDRGMIKSEEYTKHIIDKIYNEQKSGSNKDIPIFIIEPPLTPTKQKRMLTELLLESYDFPKIFFGSSGVLSLYAYGKTNGVVLESGEGLTHITPIYQGFKLNQAVEQIELGGQDVTNYLQNLLRKKGINLCNNYDRYIAVDIKEKICSLSKTKIEKDMKLFKNAEWFDDGDDFEYELPDGEVLKIGYEKKLAPEILFEPGIIGKEYPGLPQLLDQQLQKIDMDLRKVVYNSIYLSGGNTQISGFTNRFISELDQIVSSTNEFNVLGNNQNRSLLAWQGASHVTNMNQFSKMWINKKSYDEEGDRIFDKNYF